MVENIKFRLEEFKKFYDLLMQSAPAKYIPWFFPCEIKGKNPSPAAILKKDPLSKGSWHSQAARLTKEEALSLIKQGYNIGIAAREDDSLIIGDIDNPDFLKQMPKETLTTISRKRAGGHFFGWDKDGSAKINLPTDNGEMRCCNQYVLAPGSYVPFNLKSKKDKAAIEKLPQEAREDEFLGYYSVNEATSPKSLAFSDLPEFFKEKEKENIDFDSKIKNQEEIAVFGTGGKYTELFKLKVADIIGKIPAKKRVGHPLHESDTDANFSLSKDGSLGHCWRHMVSLNAIQFLCVKAGYMKCEDAGTPHKHRGYSKIKGDKKALEIAYKEAVRMGVIKEYKKESNDFLIYNENGKPIGISIDGVVDYLLEKYNFKTIFHTKSETIYFYRDGLWAKEGRAKIKTEVEKLLGTWSKNNVVNEILEKIKRKTEIRGEEFNKIPEGFICIENGILDLRKQELLDHSPDYYFKNKIPLFYNPKAKCPNIKKFFDEILYKENVPLIEEWFGFNLYNKYFKKKALILFGERDTGKTVLVGLLTNFVGEKNKVGLSLQKITFNKSFDLLCLKDKYSNIHDDLSSKDLTDVGGFKIATGGGYITGEEKFGDHIDFLTFAKHTFATNKIPPVKDINDDAYFSRWMPVAFDNIIPEKDQDEFLISKITTPQELSGLLNLALKGLKRLLENKKFSFYKSVEEVKEIMQRSSHPLSAFAQDCLKQKNGEKIIKNDLFAVYTKWCEEKKIARMSKEQIGRQLERFVPYILAQHSGKNRIWENVVFSALGDDLLKKVLENRQKHKGINTSNTLLKIMSGYSKKERKKEENNENKIIHIIKKEPLEVLGKTNEKKDKIDFSKSGINEILEAKK